MLMYHRHVFTFLYFTDVLCVSHNEKIVFLKTKRLFVVKGDKYETMLWYMTMEPDIGYFGGCRCYMCTVPCHSNIHGVGLSYLYELVINLVWVSDTYKQSATLIITWSALTCSAWLRCNCSILSTITLFGIRPTFCSVWQYRV